MSRPIKFSKRYCKVLGSVCTDKHYSVYLFMYIIITYALENNAAFNTLLKNKNKRKHPIKYTLYFHKIENSISTLVKS